MYKYKNDIVHLVEGTDNFYRRNPVMYLYVAWLW